MIKPVTIFSGALGLNTVDPPYRVESTKAGACDLTAAVNVSIDRSGRVSMRPGIRRLQSGNFHSLFCDGGPCLVGVDDKLFQVGTEYSLTELASGLQGTRIDYVQSGEKTFFTNGYQSDYVKDGQVWPWQMGTYLGPETTRHFEERPVGSHLEIHAGRMYIAQGSVLWWSEMFQFGLFNFGESGVQFHTDIRMVRSVESGLFVSTARNVYFLAGVKPMEFQRRKVSDYPAVEWSDAIQKVPLAEVGFQSGGMGVLWASPEGSVVGSPEGFAANLTKKKIIYPENVRTGFGCLRGYHYIHGVK